MSAWPLSVDLVVARMLAAALSVIFIIGAGQKFRDLAAFRAALEDYRLLPAALLAPVAVLLPAGEAAAGLALVFDQTRYAGAVLALAVLALVTGAVAINLWRGRAEIDCGCGGLEQQQTLSWGLVARNGLLACGVIGAAAGSAARQFVWLDYLTVGCGTLALLGVYVAGNQLLANRPRLWRLSNGL